MTSLKDLIPEAVEDVSVVKHIPLTDIHANDNFNCRGTIAPIDVVDLMKSIQEVGKLIQPLSVRVYDEKNKNLFGKPYGLLVGYRRFKAVSMLGWKSVSCVVLEGISDVQARIINITENLKRKDLNMVQEAKSIEQFFYLNFSRKDIGAMIGQSEGWVQVRCMILELQTEIQEVVAAGLLNQTQIRDIYSMPKDKRLEAVRAVKVAKERGESSTVITQSMSKKKSTKRRRTTAEVYQLMNDLRACVGPSVITRALAWANGEITDGDLYEELNAYIKMTYGKSFDVPKDFII